MSQNNGSKARLLILLVAIEQGTAADTACCDCGNVYRSGRMR